MFSSETKAKVSKPFSVWIQKIMICRYLPLMLLCTVSSMAVQSASAQFYSSETEPLQPRIEAGAKVGTERSMGMLEGWMPLAQDNNSVVYADIRWTADDGNNREGNLGLGYRKIVSDKLAGGDAIVGVHGWIDRRRTDRGSTFHQITAGAEYLKEDWDVKANAYIPLNMDKEYFTPNIGQTSPYLSGTGIFVDTNGYIVEEAQPGGDVEVGYRLPVFESKLDAVRVYGGGYAFIGDQTDDVIGGRVRASVDVNPLVNVGTRFQYDEPRGSQGFLEATLRFPFSAKKRFQTNRLRARLDESPERDIDIVTGAKVDNGLRKEVVNTASGQTQRVIHVDNTAATGGDGSKENPFNTLAAAQAAMLDNDVIYVHRGDGTTTGMNQGIVINRSNVQLIGSGTDFVFDTERFTTRRSGQKPADGSIILAAASAPVITNTTPTIPGDEITGNGIAILADNAVVAGLHVNNTNYGIHAIASGVGTHFQNVTIRDNVTTNNTYGIVAHTQQNAQIDSMIIENNNMTDARGFVAQANSGSIGLVSIHDNRSAGSNTGFTVQALNSGTINSLAVNNNTSSNNLSGSSTGLYISAGDSSVIKTATITNNILTNNGQSGLLTQTTLTGQIHALMIENNQVNNNLAQGIQILAQNNSQTKNVTIRNNSSNNNATYGIYIVTQNNGLADNILIEHNSLDANTRDGIRLQTQNTSQVVTAIQHNIISNNQWFGLSVFGQNDSTISVSFSGNTVTANGTASVNPNFYYGVYVDNDTTAAYNVDLGGGSLGSAGGNRIYNNFYREVFVDSRPGTVASTPGTAISAQYNWWGIGTGLNQGTRATFDNGSASPGSSIDASNHLTSDPGI
jgi:hypothetical protein